MGLDEKEIFAQKLAKKRQLSGLTAAQLAERISETEQLIYDWESAVSMPDILQLKKLSKELKVSVDYLLSEEPDEENSKGGFQAEEIAKIFFARPVVNVIKGENSGELIVSREEIDLSSRSGKVSFGGRWNKKSSRMDLAVKEKYPDAKIFMLLAKPIAGKEKRGDKKAFYMVNLPERQFIVTVTDTYIESRETPEKITLMRFRLGEYEFTNVGLVY